MTLHDTYAFLARNPQALVYFAQFVTNGLEYWAAWRAGRAHHQVHLTYRFLHLCLGVVQDWPAT